jgi:hypothetical protein
VNGKRRVHGVVQSAAEPMPCSFEMSKILPRGFLVRNGSRVTLAKALGEI